MENIFDYSPTVPELYRLCIYDEPRDSYLKSRSQNELIWDLAVLFENRASKKADLYWNKLSDEYISYRAMNSCDDILIPVD